jgi:ubiquinone/menaquinone biosynthesis C-methylase UbiE
MLAKKFPLIYITDSRTYSINDQINTMPDLYQTGYSEYFAKYQYDRERQAQKAEKTLAVLKDYYGGPDSLEKLVLLDIGCSAGLMTIRYAEDFGFTVGIDIDEPAVSYANDNFASARVEFQVGDGMRLDFNDSTFDVVTCTHIYEHVPDYNKLMSEIRRVLRKGGICYFAAQNRITFIEPHYFLPFLSVLPKFLAHRYFRLFKKGEFYYENLLFLGQLKRLVKDFEIVDYTLKILQDPERFHVTELVSPNSLKQKMAIQVLKNAYFLCPTFIWLLRK